MDRFIDGIKNINEDVIYYLKSNMDRFIVNVSTASPTTSSLFKIQYGQIYSIGSMVCDDGTI